MKRLFGFLVIVGFGSTSLADLSGQQTCEAKSHYLKSVCKQNSSHGLEQKFDDCANGHTYSLATQVRELNPNLFGEKTACKMIETRKETSIAQRISYFDRQANKVVEYKHRTGLSNTYVYGTTGYYHISELHGGEFLYNFYSYDSESL